MISEHQEKLQKIIREINSLNILDWTDKQRALIIKARFNLEKILESD